MIHLAPIFAKVNNTFGGEAGHFFGGGESFYPSNILDRTLTGTSNCDCISHTVTRKKLRKD